MKWTKELNGDGYYFLRSTINEYKAMIEIHYGSVKELALHYTSPTAIEDYLSHEDNSGQEYLGPITPEMMEDKE